MPQTAVEPQFLPVASSWVAGISPYNPITQTFQVKLKNGSRYEYPCESQESYLLLTGAKSIGQHLNKHFRTKGVLLEDPQWSN
jgi:hypothetical protein